MTFHFVFQQKLHKLKWNKVYMNLNKPFLTMQEKANYTKHQKLQNCENTHN